MDEKGLARDLTCKICSQYVDKIKHMREFREAWVTGSQNYKVSNANDHADSASHKMAMKYYYHDVNVNVVPENGQTSLDTAFAKGDEKVAEKTKRKFEIAYFIAKEELSFKKYEKIINLEEMHGVSMGEAYRNDKSCAEFIDYLGKDIGDNLCSDLAKARFYSVLTDGSTDISTKEQESVFVLYFDPKPSETPDRVSIKMAFLAINELHAKDGGAGADGITLAICNSFHSLGITEFKSKLIGYGADGASVNRGDKNGVKARLQEMCPWLIFNWCFAHRLELSIKVLKSTSFDDVDEFLLSLYYLYEKSPKKLSQLKDLYDHFNEIYEFESKSVKPLRASGTRWISHKLGAMRLAIDKFEVYIVHMQEMSEDKSFPPAVRNKLKGYLKLWNKTSLLVKLCFFADLLEPFSKLSMAFQQDEIDPVKAINALRKIKSKLTNLKDKPLDQYLSIKLLKRKIGSNNGRDFYNEFEIKNLDQEIEIIDKNIGRYLQHFFRVIDQRFDSSDIHLEAVAKILNCQGWESFSNSDEGDMNTEFADLEISELFQKFSKPLENAGINITETEMISEWHDVLEYTMEYLSPSNIPYLKTWRRLFNCDNAEVGYKNILALIEICFVYPLSNGKLERLFSRMKRVKRKDRGHIASKSMQNLMRIGEEGKELDLNTVISAMNKWGEDKVRRPKRD